MKRLLSSLIIFPAMLVLLAGFKADTGKGRVVEKPAANKPAIARPAEGIQWLTIEEAFAKIQKEPRKILIDVYTDWCGWCKVMDRETFKDKTVTEYINKKYYAVKLDAEQKGTIKLGDKEFKYLAQGGRGINEIALALTNNQPSYPTTVFLDDKFNMIQPLPGYLKAKEFHQIITFFGDDHHKKQDFESYKAKTYGTLYPAK
ncbi:thioredoxin family protein [Dyadobacter endophyticus]|uniref:thioredoxin family protein n=1 Tax=Dyadobacter endophyticus TaxID=1749036 RepID=UPI003CFA118B